MYAVYGNPSLCDQLHHATSLLDLLLGVLGEISRAHNNGDGWDAALAEHLAVAEGEEVEDGRFVGGLVLEVFVALVDGDERPELCASVSICRRFEASSREETAYLVEVDHRLPELVLQLVEIPHADLAKVTRMILVDVRPVVMRATGHTTTTGVLPVLANAAMTGGNVAATGGSGVSKTVRMEVARFNVAKRAIKGYSVPTYCFLVFVNRVGILSDGLWSRCSVQWRSSYFEVEGVVVERN
jgi:hypothetical protein